MLNNVIVTTSVNSTPELDGEAKKLAEIFGFKYEKRNKKTLMYFLKFYSGILVCYKDKLSYFSEKGELFFHPDTALLRIKNNDNEPLIDIIGTGPKTIIDATMGLASDSIVLSYYGNKVIALEENAVIHLIVSKGLKTYTTGNEKVDRAMKKITTKRTDSLSYLKKCSTKSVDVVYFDPMFSKGIEESKNLVGLADLASSKRLSKELLEEAKRVAREKIIVKAHYRDNVFENLGFKRIIRKNTKFHYGYLDVEE